MGQRVVAQRAALAHACGCPAALHAPACHCSATLPWPHLLHLRAVVHEQLLDGNGAVQVVQLFQKHDLLPAGVARGEGVRRSGPGQPAAAAELQRCSSPPFHVPKTAALPDTATATFQTPTHTGGSGLEAGAHLIIVLRTE